MKSNEFKKLVKAVLKEATEVGKSDETDSPIEYLGDNFTPAEKLILIKVINTFSLKGGHAQPDVKNIGQFGKKWVISMLGKAEKLLKTKPEYAKELAILMKIKQKLVPSGLAEESSTGAVAGYSTPFAFTKNKKGSPKGIAAAEKYGKVVGESPRV